MESCAGSGYEKVMGESTAKVFPFLPQLFILFIIQPRVEAPVRG